jgi:hypothetical protein
VVGSESDLKPNVIGIVGGIIAFISLLLPWWTVAISSGFGLFSSETYSIYPYQVTLSIGGVSAAVTVDIWYGGVALALLILGGFLAIMSSIFQTARKVLVLSGLFAFVGILIFAVGLQNELSNASFVSELPAISLFYDGTIGANIFAQHYTAYLSYGFWLALASGIIMLVAFTRKPKVNPPPPTVLPEEKAAPENEPSKNV